jgi:hypothetical protein
MSKKPKKLEAKSAPGSTLGEQIAGLRQRVAEQEIAVARAKSEVVEEEITRQRRERVVIGGHVVRGPRGVAVIGGTSVRRGLVVTPALALGVEERVGTRLLTPQQESILRIMGHKSRR